MVVLSLGLQKKHKAFPKVVGDNIKMIIIVKRLAFWEQITYHFTTDNMHVYIRTKL